MKHRLSNGVLATIIIVVAVLVDQILKLWVKTSFFYGEEVKIAEWFRLVFIENNGMAFGMELGSKFFLTWFRIIAVVLLIWYLLKLRRRTDVPKGYFVCIAFITAGALGNVIDCIFYGVVFDAPQAPQVAQFFPPGGGYESLFNGRVVDMFYFPLCEWDWPQWMPVIGGQHFKFFEPIFNFADACLSVSVITLILFYSKYFINSGKKKEEATEEMGEDTPSSEIPTEE